MQLCKEPAGGVAQGVGNADKLRDQRSATTIGTGQGGWRVRGQVTGQTGVVDEFVLFDRSVGLARPSRSRAASEVKFCVAALSIIWWYVCRVLQVLRRL